MLFECANIRKKIHLSKKTRENYRRITKKTAFCARNLFDFEKLKFDSVELEFDSSAAEFDSVE